MFCESLRPNPSSGNNEEATAESNLTNLLRTIQSQNQQIMEKLNSTLASDNDIDKRGQGKRKEVPRRVEVGVMMILGPFSYCFYFIINRMGIPSTSFIFHF